MVKAMDDLAAPEMPKQHAQQGITDVRFADGMEEWAM